ncbi:PEP/pyruvate binding domain protein [Olavius algarvensis associated proteobacterium Delta 3]|nr:PEP/pyruvate binding domain protein [Olavius algarvensis associated proteobacterium Delta 3]
MRLQVPPGFVITTRAYVDFMRYNQMDLYIRQQLDQVDIKNYDALLEVSGNIQHRILAAQLPPDLKAAIIDHYQLLCQHTGSPDLKVALRSSAIKEDAHASFAGQYSSFLNVPAGGILESYKSIIGCQFAPRGIFYYKDKKFHIEHMAMAVGMQAMVIARASGVAYSRDPSQPEAPHILINAVRGLGTYAVEGKVKPDTYCVSADPMMKIADLQPNQQDIMLSAHVDGWTHQEAVPTDQIGHPCLNDSTVLELATQVNRIEQHYGQPQDIEWAVDQTERLFFLQSRPLRLTPKTLPPGEIWPTRIEGHSKLFDTGTVVNRGVAAGPIYRVLNEKHMAAFPEGGVLVIRHSDPEYAILLKRAAAVVAEVGSPLSHLATVVREYNIPAIFNVTGAAGCLHDGNIVTVDGVYANIYEGRVEELLTRQLDQGSFSSTQIVQQLKDILKYVTPLHLTDPRSPSFRPSACRTLHDITRFCHEVAMQTMFNLSKDSHFSEHSAKRLVAHVPLQWWVIDLKDGIHKEHSKKTVALEDIRSIPFLALWEGMTALPWKGPPPVDTKGFLATMLKASMDPSIEPAVGKRFVDRNYILVAKNFCNVSTRLGFHFSTLESYVGDHANQNYVSFVFTGGGADDARRNRRAQLIARLIDKFGFRVEVKGNSLFARIEGYPADLIRIRLKILGHIIIHTRQLDMAMYNDRMVDWYLKENIKAIKSFIDRDNIDS